MKILFLFLILSIGLTSAVVSPNEAVTITGEKLADIGKNTDIYAENLGVYILKFQGLFMQTLDFVSLGFFDISDEMDFARFLFFILLFMMLYTIIGFISNKFNFWIAGIITVLAFMGINEEILKSIFLNYEAMGITITVILPVLILLAFTFRIYEKAYEGNGQTSPFYAEMFNLIFMCFFGWFFIQYSWEEEGLIALIRLYSGIFLIIMGISQTILYKIFARFLHIQRVKGRKFQESIKKMRQDFVDAKNEIEIESMRKSGSNF